MNQRSFMEYALAYARRGMRVFPLHAVHSGDCSCGRDGCSSAGKHPRTKNGVKDATTDVEQIAHWWNSWPEANIGLATGNGLYVVDVDCAKGATMASLEAYGLDLTWTLTARTGSGGYHLYLRCPLNLPNTANKLAPFVDTRGENGYVVAPPSRNKCGSYAWYNNQPIQDMPPALLERLCESAPFLSAPLKPYSINDRSFATAEPTLAREQKEEQGEQGRQQQRAPLASSQSNVAPGRPDDVASEARNNYLISRAGCLRSDGFNVAEIREMLLALNESRYGHGRHPQGPLSREELDQTIFKTIQRWTQIGGSQAVAPAEMLSLRKLMSMDLPPTRWVVEGLLTEGLTLLAGKPKVGKSWLILDLALTCALGTAVRGRQALGRYAVEPMSVFYLSLEDNAERLRSRVLKLLGTSSVPDTFGYALRWKNLPEGGLQDLETCLLTEPHAPRLVIIDTLARVRRPLSTTGNTYQEESSMMAQLQVFAHDHHLALVVIHHLRKTSGEDVFDEISGTLGLTGSADTSIILKRGRTEKDGTLHITGRDVEEQELALTFSDACLWSITGSTTERQLSQMRQEILNLLSDNDPMTPAEIAKALDKLAGTVRMTLHRLVQEGAVVKKGYARYTLSAQQA